MELLSFLWLSDYFHSRKHRETEYHCNQTNLRNVSVTKSNQRRL